MTDLQPENVLDTDWWLDGSALPELCWARVRVFDDLSVEVLDRDGQQRRFAAEEEARAWLCADAYEPLTWLIACGSVSASTRPPCEAFGGPQDWGPPPPESASTLPFEQWLRETAERIEDSRRRRR